jgi:hypothetical protein
MPRLQAVDPSNLDTGYLEPGMRKSMLPEFIAVLWLRIRALLRRRQLDRDLNDELQFHLAMCEEKLAKPEVPAEEIQYAGWRRLELKDLLN